LQWHRRYRKEWVAATKIQGCWRKNLAIDVYRCRRACATMIQASYRGYGRYCEHQKMLLAVLSIQAWWRVLQWHRRYRKEWVAATKIQGCWRKNLAIDVYRSRRACATMIQAAYRGHRRCSQYTRIVRAVSAVQARYHVLQYRQHQNEWQAATKIQALWRRCLTFDVYQSHRACAAMIQATYRGYICRSESKRVELAVRVIQTFARNIRHRQCQKLAAVKKIQCLWRVCTAVHDCRMRRACLILLQSFYRKHRCCSAYLRNRRATIMLQSCYRRSRDTYRFQRSRRCIIALQAMVRRTVAKSQYATVLSAVVAIQTAVRCWLMRRLLSFRRFSSIVIQNQWRGFSSRRLLARKCQAIVTIQAFTRASFARALVRLELGNRRYDILFDSSATSIQAWYRRWLCQKCMNRMKTAVGKIQMLYFTWKLSHALPKLRTSVALLERRYCGQLSRLASRFALLQTSSLLRLRHTRCALESGRLECSTILAWNHVVSRARQFTCIVIQRAYRGYHCRRLVRGQERAALLLQLAVRCFLLKQKIHADSLSKLQTHRFYRKRVAVKLLRKLDDKRVEVEFCPVLYFQQRHAARTIQAFFTRELTRRKGEERLVLFRAFQFRCRHAATVLQSFARAFLERQAQRRIAEAAAAGVRKAAVERETAAVLQWVNEAADREVHRLLQGNWEFGTTSVCIQRLARRVREARALDAMSATSVDDVTPVRTNKTIDTLELSKEKSLCAEEKKLDDTNRQLFADVDSLLSPIKPIQDGWERGDNE